MRGGGLTNSKTIKDNFESKISNDSLIIDVSYTASSINEAIDTLNYIMYYSIETANSLDSSGEPVYKLLNKSLSILTPATEEHVTNKDSILKITLIGLAAGIVLAFLYCILVELLDNKFKKPEEIEKELNQTIFSIIPFIGAKNNKDNQIENEDYSKIISKEDPFSVVSESYRKARVAIEYSNIDSKHQVIQILSSIQGEGKTTAVLNLASVFKESNKRVCVIDLDFRRPKLHRAFNIQNKDGITDLLISKVELKDAIKHNDSFGFDIINRGTEVPYPQTILSSDELRKLIDELRKVYDYILIDCPPILALSDGTIINSLSDDLLFVINKNTEKSLVKDAIKTLKLNNVNISGLLVTGFTSSEGGYYSKKYKYYNNYYKKK